MLGGTGIVKSFEHLILYYDQQLHNYFTNYHTATCYMFRHYRVILREFLVSTLPSYTRISQIITLLHVSTLSCHPHAACNQYLAKLHKYFKCSYKFNYKNTRLKLLTTDAAI